MKKVNTDYDDEEELRRARRERRWEGEERKGRGLKGRGSEGRHENSDRIKKQQCGETQ